MADVEVYSWLFVFKEWDRLRRQPTADKGFEESFREYLYRKINFDTRSDTRDMGFGLSCQTLSGMPHELDVICIQGKNLLIFELKHYDISDLTKEIVFTFLGKVLDFYFKNISVLSDFNIRMFLVTINRSIDESIRRLCITYGVKLIEPSLMTMKVMDHFLRDLYEKSIGKDDELNQKTSELIEGVSKLREQYDYSFSDIFRQKDGKIEVELPLLNIQPSEALNKVRECYALFERARATSYASRIFTKDAGNSHTAGGFEVNHADTG